MASITGTFIDYASSYTMQKQEAELYERVYPYAAEDWVAHPDNNLRHDNIDLYIQELTLALNEVKMWLLLHNHQAQGPFSPTSPPIPPLIVLFPNGPVGPQNTTGAQSNITGNRLIPFQYLSYIDERTNSTNKSISVFRRQLQIPINTADLTPSLTRI